MPTSLPKELLRIRYEEAAESYLKSLRLENIMEASAQGRQREITLESLALVRGKKPDIHVFNEMLVQYPLDQSGKKIGQVVPDNMVVLWDGPLKVSGSYSIPFQPARPFWTLEYVSKHNKRKDYEENLVKYEQKLQVPYYLVFYPDNEEMTLYKLTQGKYLSVKPNKQNRCPIRRLEMEIGLLGGWVRFWLRGDLLPLPADLQLRLEETEERLAVAEIRAEQEGKRAEQEKQARLAAEQENASLRQELERLRGQSKA
jgi:Uma2 family endonuclease